MLLSVAAACYLNFLLPCCHCLSPFIITVTFVWLCVETWSKFPSFTSSNSHSLCTIFTASSSCLHKASLAGGNVSLARLYINRPAGSSPHSSQNLELLSSIQHEINWDLFWSEIIFPVLSPFFTKNGASWFIHIFFAVQYVTKDLCIVLHDQN